jgi:hypothetical protein
MHLPMIGIICALNRELNLYATSLAGHERGADDFDKWILPQSFFAPFRTALRFRNVDRSTRNIPTIWISVWMWWVSKRTHLEST